MSKFTSFLLILGALVGSSAFADSYSDSCVSLLSNPGAAERGACQFIDNGFALDCVFAVAAPGYSEIMACSRIGSASEMKCVDDIGNPTPAQILSCVSK